MGWMGAHGWEEEEQEEEHHHKEEEVKGVLLLQMPLTYSCWGLEAEEEEDQQQGREVPVLQEDGMMMRPVNDNILLAK